MNGPTRWFGGRLALALLGMIAVSVSVSGAEPPAIDPFGPREETREGAVPGYVELSDGTVRAGSVSLTRDARLKVFDARLKRQREVPLASVGRVDCKVEREWLEPEWRFKENANDAKVYTGRSYPTREYIHVITLRDGRELRGPLSALVYVQGESGEPEKFLLHKRDKGPAGTDLKSLVYVSSVRLGADSLEEGKRKSEALRARTGEERGR